MIRGKIQLRITNDGMEAVMGGGGSQLRMTNDEWRNGGWNGGRKEVNHERRITEWRNEGFTGRRRSQTGLVPLGYFVPIWHNRRD